MWYIYNRNELIVFEPLMNLLTVHLLLIVFSLLTAFVKRLYVNDPVALFGS